MAEARPAPKLRVSPPDPLVGADSEWARKSRDESVSFSVTRCLFDRRGVTLRMNKAVSGRYEL